MIRRLLHPVTVLRTDRRSATQPPHGTGCPGTSELESPGGFTAEPPHTAPAATPGHASDSYLALGQD
eukprot:754853-Hanusia_phi.AAC.3